MKSGGGGATAKVAAAVPCGGGGTDGRDGVFFICGGGGTDGREDFLGGGAKEGFFEAALGASNVRAAEYGSF